MRILAALILALHGFAHLVGFRAAFWPTAIQPRRSIHLNRKVEGIVWGLLALGFVGAATLLVLENSRWPTLLIGATVGSLLMCVVAWPETKVGLLVDVALLIATVLLVPNRAPYLVAAFERETRAAQRPVREGEPAVIDQAQITLLPRPVQRYLTFMGVAGRPRDWSIRASFNGRFRRAVGPWSACQAIQYDTRRPVSRVFMMQLALSGFLPVTVRDIYTSGRGTLQAKAFDWFAVAEGRGHELDVGELVTYLNDALLLAPSMLLGPEATWTFVDENAFDVTLRDSELSVTGRVFLDAQGALVDFSTTDRFFDRADGKRLRTEWRTPVRGWQDVGGRKLPTQARAVWQLPDGPFAYADFDFDAARIAFNVPPS